MKVVSIKPMSEETLAHYRGWRLVSASKAERARTAEEGEEPEGPEAHQAPGEPPAEAEKERDSDE